MSFNEAFPETAHIYNKLIKNTNNPYFNKN